MEIGAGETTCFWLDRTERVRLSLRRFTFSVAADDEDDGLHHDCPAGSSGCDASVDLDVLLPIRWRREDGYGPVMLEVPRAHRPGRRDPRWPKTCARCGEPFPRRAMWQVNQAEEYRRLGSDELVYIPHWGGRELAGALFDAWWLHGRQAQDGQGCVGSDGIALVAVLPSGLPWEFDGTATGGGRWTRVGDPRRPETLTVSPSIVGGGYHGFLQAGRFTGHIG